MRGNHPRNVVVELAENFAMWQALNGVDGLDAELGRADLDRLIFRARQQREALEPHRLEAAAGAFTTTPDR